MAESTGKYLYCVVKEKKPQKPRTRAKLGAGLVQNRNGVSGSGFILLGQAPLEVNGEKLKHREIRPLTGQDGKEVYTVHFGDLAIVVSDTEKEEYHFIKEYLTCHQKVIEQVMNKGYDVLPVRFGTVASSADYIQEKLLKAKSTEFLETFPIVEGRVELGVRVFWKDMPSIFQEIVKENKEIQIAKKEAEKNPNQFKLAKVGEMVQKALEIKRQKEMIEILTPLKKLAVDFKERELIRQRDILRDSMIVSSAFLVAKENEDEFDKRVESFMKKHEGRMRFKYIGPIPPFNFVELHLKI